MIGTIIKLVQYIDNTASPITVCELATELAVYRHDKRFSAAYDQIELFIHAWNTNTLDLCIAQNLLDALRKCHLDAQSRIYLTTLHMPTVYDKCLYQRYLSASKVSSRGPVMYMFYTSSSDGPLFKIGWTSDLAQTYKDHARKYRRYFLPIAVVNMETTTRAANLCEFIQYKYKEYQYKSRKGVVIPGFFHPSVEILQTFDSL